MIQSWKISPGYSAETYVFVVPDVPPMPVRAAIRGWYVPVLEVVTHPLLPHRAHPCENDGWGNNPPLPFVPQATNCPSCRRRQLVALEHVRARLHCRRDFPSNVFSAVLSLDRRLPRCFGARDPCVDQIKIEYEPRRLTSFINFSFNKAISRFPPLL